MNIACFVGALPIIRRQIRSRHSRIRRALSRTSASVIVRGGELRQAAEQTAVRFRTLTPEEIERYIATGEPMDKAGAYGIQGRGALFVAHLDGDYFNVMGLPLCRLGQLLNELGVELL